MDASEIACSNAASAVSPHSSLAAAATATPCAPSPPVQDLQRDLKAAHRRDASRAPTPSFDVKSLVLLWYPPTHKLDTPYRGPFVVKSRRTPS